MGNDITLECAFLVPMKRDAVLSDGESHDAKQWDWLDEQLFELFKGNTAAPGLFQGSYADPDTGERVRDESRKFIVAVAESRIAELRDLLKQVCQRFQQKSIYLSVAGRVEFVRLRDG